MKRIIYLLPVLLLVACGNKTETSPINTPMHAEKKRDTIAFKSGYADINGLHLYYEMHGAGRPLVLIHGGGSTIQSTFGRIIPTLAQKHLLIAVELQAHGRTGDRNTPISFEQDADDVAGLLKHLNIAQADFFGFSNGGNTALQIGIRHPDLCRKIVAGSFLLKRDGTFPQFWEFMKAGTFEQMPQQYKDAFMKVNPDSTKLHNMFEKCAQRMIHFKDMSDAQIKSIRCPVLLVNGDADVATSEHVVAMSRLIPHCQLAILPGRHGEYLGEITTLDSTAGPHLTILPVLENFLDQ